MKRCALILSAALMILSFSPALALAAGPPPAPIVPMPPQPGMPSIQDTFGRLIALQQRISDAITNSQFPLNASDISGIMSEISSELSQLAAIIQRGPIPQPGDLMRLDSQIDQTRQKLDFILLGR